MSYILKEDEYFAQKTIGLYRRTIFVAFLFLALNFLGFSAPLNIRRANLDEDLQLLKYGYAHVGQRRDSPVTIVTSYYPLGRSKHSQVEYGQWIANFFPKVTTPMVIFTSCQIVEEISRWRNELVGTVVCYDYNDVPPLVQWRDVYRVDQFSIDPEKDIHTYELYLIWNAKPWFLAETSKWNPFQSKYFLWVDAGSFRENDGYRNWPSISRLESIFENRSNQVLLGVMSCPFLEIEKPYVERNGPLVQNFIQGTFFAGMGTGISWWATEFYRLHDVFITMGKFVGKDQEIMNTMALLHPHHVFFLDTRESCQDPWFFFQPFLSLEEELPPICYGIHSNATELKTICPTTGKALP